MLTNDMCFVLGAFGKVIMSLCSTYCY